MGFCYQDKYGKFLIPLTVHTIAVFEVIADGSLKLIEIVPTGGLNPRGFTSPGSVTLPHCSPSGFPKCHCLQTIQLLDVCSLSHDFTFQRPFVRFH